MIVRYIFANRVLDLCDVEREMLRVTAEAYREAFPRCAENLGNEIVISRSSRLNKCFVLAPADLTRQALGDVLSTGHGFHFLSEDELNAMMSSGASPNEVDVALGVLGWVRGLDALTGRGEISA